MVRFSYSKEIDEREPWAMEFSEIAVNDAVARHTTFRIVKGFQKKVRFSFKSGNFEFIIVDYRKSHPDGRWINVPSLSQWFEVLPALKREVSPKYHGGLYDSFKYWTWMLFPYFNTEYSQIKSNEKLIQISWRIRGCAFRKDDTEDSFKIHRRTIFF